MSDCGDEAIEDELRACKIQHSVVENASAATAGLLKTGKLLGNFQRAICSPLIASPHVARVENSSEHSISAKHSGRGSDAKIRGKDPFKCLRRKRNLSCW